MVCKRGVRGVRIPYADRFWEKVDKRGGPNACWNWLAARTTNGYGIIRGDAPAGVACNLRAHRVAWELSTGQKFPAHIPGKTIELRHKCDNRLCCNPRHLEVGMRIDNVMDMYRRGRANPFGRWSSVKGRLRKPRREAFRLWKHRQD